MVISEGPDRQKAAESGEQPKKRPKPTQSETAIAERKHVSCALSSDFRLQEDGLASLCKELSDLRVELGGQQFKNEVSQTAGTAWPSNVSRGPALRLA